MIVGVTLARDDAWILPRKLDAYSRFCDVVIVVLDRPTPEVVDICARFPKVAAVEHANTLGLPDFGPDGPICEEGRMRQRGLDEAGRLAPRWVIFGDADEIPSPGIVPFLSRAEPHVDIWRCPWIHLFKRPEVYAGGSCAWSPENPAATRKGVALRWKPGMSYRYEDLTRHTPLEPSSAARQMVVADTVEFCLMHWKYTDWPRWKASPQSRLDKYRDYWRGLRLRKTPKEWMWPPI